MRAERTGRTWLKSVAGRRKWGRLILLFAAGAAIGTAQVIVLRHLWGIPSAGSFIAVVLILAVCDFLFAWNVERTTRREGPGVWNSIVGRQGRVISAVGRQHDEAGAVRVAGEIWKARCRQATTVRPGQRVLVTAREGLIVTVEPLGSEHEHAPVTSAK